MHYEPELRQARLLKRYKRFLTDIRLDSGEEITIHCANTGAMTGCAEPGNIVYYSTSSNPKRKYPHSWEWSQTTTGDKICINTLRANHLTVEGIKNGTITELSGYAHLDTEVRYGSENSRIDIYLKSDNQVPCYVEVKSVTLLEDNGRGFFPDAITTRGQKHLRELITVALNGDRAVLFFAVLHSGIENVSVAHHIDADYSLLLRQAIEAGVEIICYKAGFFRNEIRLIKPVKFLIGG